MCYSIFSAPYSFVSSFSNINNDNYSLELSENSKKIKVIFEKKSFMYFPDLHKIHIESGEEVTYSDFENNDYKVSSITLNFISQTISFFSREYKKVKEIKLSEYRQIAKVFAELEKFSLNLALLK